ncbi:MAG: UDP-N-acetylenolpyruvoylglucosamine reductase, partial [Candidatus Moranbacteria bacterium]|nr:UDP-N-acetylenolpyruvoylglucosamine reductase [Candidatus Moranbacteria bacterium]
VKALHPKTLQEKVFSNQECHFSYRSSVFKEEGWIVIEVTFTLRLGEKEFLAKTMEEIVAQRNAKHNQSALCAGSFFINPLVEKEELRKDFEKESNSPCREKKVPAGWLIDKMGLRGKKIGGAMVSEMHPNYIINTGDATAEDVIMLMSYIKQQVRDGLGVQLTQEVQLVGFE